LTLYKKTKQIIDESIFNNPDFIRGFHEFKDINVLNEIKNIHFANGEQFDDVISFYYKSGFIYPGKKHLLFDNKNDIKHTWDKLLTNNNTVKIVFYKDGNEIIGSAMSAQYTDSTWIFQHICVLPEYRHTIIPKLVSLANTYAGLHNPAIKNVMIFYQEHTRWAKKSFEGFYCKINDTSQVDIFPMTYLYCDLNACQISKNSNIRNSLISEPIKKHKDVKIIFNFMKNRYQKLFLDAYGLNEKDYHITKAKKQFSNLGLIRDRQYFIVKDKGEIIGFAFCDISSKGISFSNFFDHFQIFIFNNKSYSYAIQPLLNSIIEFYKFYNRSNLFCLCMDNRIIDLLQSVGFICLKIYKNCIFNQSNNKFVRFYNYLAENRKWNPPRTGQKHAY